MKPKCLILFSGGLDSRLVIKIMEEKGYDVLAVYFKLPFGCSNYNEVIEFSKEHNINLKIFNCTKGKLLQEYIQIIKEGKHGRGAGINPCRDCKIFIHSKAKEYADKLKINLIVNGDVLGERPMSQMKSSMEIIEKSSGLSGKLLRPLSAKLLPNVEGIDKNDYYDIHGRQRKKQIALAEKFNIEFPYPTGGCLLCEKALQCKFEKLFERGLTGDETHLINTGRHFMINNCWTILGKDQKDNTLLEQYKKIGTLIQPDFAGPSALILNKPKEKTLKKVNEIIKAYSTKGNLEDRKKFEEFKL